MYKYVLFSFKMENSCCSAIAQITESIKNYLIERKIQPNTQPGFRQRHSTTTAMLKIVDDILEAQDNAELTVVVLLDYSKTFDLLDHKLLIAKLRVNIRHGNQLSIPKHRSAAFEHSFSYNSVNIYNSVPPEIKSQSTVFKKVLKLTCYTAKFLTHNYISFFF
nr:unnamed protein product [Callosobruchus analis]